MSTTLYQAPPSCWTCRVRRKKCDRTKPRCHACAALEITCHYADVRPDWMDGGERQNDMARRIKAEVRQGAEARRERQYIQVLTLHEDRMRIDDQHGGQPDQLRPRLNSFATAAGGGGGSSEETGGDRSAGSGSERDAGAMVTTPGVNSTPNTSPPSWTSTPVCPDCAASGFVARPLPASHEYTVWDFLGLTVDQEQGAEAARDVETDFTITFLDYVFPFLFPFYQPSVLEGGRSWLLAMLRNNTAFFHSGMSLSAYFFTLVMKGGERHKVCSQLIWNKLVGHVDTAVRAMQQDMEDIKRGGSGATVDQRGKTMESIVQLLILEHSMARTNDWNVHLSAAMAIFQELFEELGTNKDGTPNMAAVVRALAKQSWLDGMSNDTVVWHSDQGAFRFYTAALLYHDIIAATCLESPPRLRKYHSVMVQEGSVNPPIENLRMENFFGCQGWVLLAISDIAVLDAAKKETKARGTFRPHELMESGSRLHARLHGGMARLERDSFRKRTAFDITAVLRSFYRPDAAHAARLDEQLAATRIWALAAMAYLSVVVTGWAAATRTTTSSIAVAMQLLYGISSPAVLRSLAWPFYVLGCLATREQEQLFTHMASTMGPLLEFGTIGEAVRIMKRVWELRDEGALDPETWDIAACSRVFGTYVLMT